jgi:hypothetical protein
LAELDRAGLPVIEHFRGTLPVAADEVRPRYREVILNLPAGVTHFALHATMPGEIEAIAPDHAGWRTREFTLFREGAGAEWCAAAEIVAIRYRDIRKLWRDAVAGQARAITM